MSPLRAVLTASCFLNGLSQGQSLCNVTELTEQVIHSAVISDTHLFKPVMIYPTVEAAKAEADVLQERLTPKH